MVLGLIKILGVVIFLYLIWRNLYDDYQDDLLVSYGWSSMLIVLIGGKLGYELQNWRYVNYSGAALLQFWKSGGFSLVGSVVMVMLWTWWYCARNGWKLWSFCEDVIPIYYLFAAFILGGEFVKSDLNWKLLAVMTVVVLAYIFSSNLKGRYRSFTWYRSGKKGFVFFFINMIFGLVMAVMSLLFKDGWYVSILYLVISLIFGVGLAILGG
jgi:hypothetical protein